MLQNLFTEKDIPYKEFKRVGILKEDILTKIDKEDLQALLSGKRTKLFNIKGIDDKGQNFSASCKFSLQRENNETVSLQIHPKRTQIKNDIGLSKKDLDKLEQGDSVVKSVNGERFLIQLDKDTKELLRTKTKDIFIPAYLQDVKIDSQQREKLRQGKEISIDLGTEKVSAKIDLDSSNGLRFSNFDQKQKEAYDFHNHAATGFLQTDRNSQEYLSSLKNN